MLFGRCHLTYADAERELGRPLSGTPSDGELAVLSHLNGDRFQAAREALDQDDFANDFRALVQARLELVAVRNGRLATQRVRIPFDTLEHYQRLGQRANLPVAECLEQAIARDRQTHDDAGHAAKALTEAVETYHKAAAHIATLLEQLRQRMGPIEDITARLGRIEGALQSLANRR
jgi:AcrR family transcriptional regulator